MSQLLLDKISEVRSRGMTVSVGAGVGRVVVWVVGAALLVMAADYWLDLHMAVRAVWLSGLLGAAGYLVWWGVIRVLQSPPTDDRVALWIEGDQPGLRQRLISAVQLARDSGGASPSMVAAMTVETEELIAPADLTDVVKSDPLYKWLGGAATAIVVMGLVLLVGGASSRDLLLRALCVPGIEVPRKTRIEVLTPADLVVARGDDVVLAARASGVIPDAGEIEVVFASGAKQTYPLPRVPEPPSDDAPPSNQPADPPPLSRDRFSVTLRGVSEAFTYRLTLNDARTPTAAVRVSVRPVAQKVEAFVTPPAYTKLPPSRVPTGDLVLLEGSRLGLSVTSSKPVKLTGPITGTGAGQNRVLALSTSPAGPQPPRAFALRRDPTNPTQLATADGASDSIILPKNATGIAVVLVDEEGLETRDPTVYRVQIVPDRPPTVRVIVPQRKEEVVTRSAVPRIGFEASDDLALGSLKLRYIVRAPAADQVGNAAAGGGGMVAGAPPANLPNLPDPPVPPSPQTPEPAAQDDRAARSLDLDVAPGSKSLRGFYPWRLVSLSAGGLPEGSVVEWWLEAADTNNVTGPGIGRSERFLFRIGTEAQVRDALMARLSGSFGSLQDSQQNQQDLTRDLGQLILEKPLQK